MDTFRKFRDKLEYPAQSDYKELETLALAPAKPETEFLYQDSRSSQDTQISSHERSNTRDFSPTQLRQSRVLKATTSLLIVALAVLSTLNIILLLYQLHTQQGVCHQGSDTPYASKPQHKTTIDCGSSVAEAKAKGCTWDELTKAWLPAECPRFGIDEYKSEGIIHSPHDNATGWSYYWDQAGMSSLNFNVVSADETRDPNGTVWSTTRQHLTHCAWSLKRVLWSYENGYGQYDKVSQMHHFAHCVDRLFQRAVRGDHDVDKITTTARVHFGTCTF